MADSPQGFILLHRRIREHWIWKDPARFQWWCDILMECNHDDRQVLIGNTLMDCKRGQSLNSIPTWAKQWRVDVGVVKRFFKLLRSCSMISTENVQKTTLLTVCNYDTYNSQRPVRDLSVTSSATCQRPTNNNKSNINKSNSIDTLSKYTPAEIQKWQDFEKWLQEKAPNVLKMDEPFTIEQYFRIKTKYSAQEVSKTLKQMHNYKGIKKNVSAYLTCLNWLDRSKDKEAEVKKEPERNESGKLVDLTPRKHG